MKKVRAVKPIVLGEITITVMELVTIYHGTVGRGLWGYASKEPIGLFVSSPAGRWFIDLNAENPTACAWG